MSELLRGLIMEIPVMVPSYVLFLDHRINIIIPAGAPFEYSQASGDFFMALSAERSA